MTTHYLQQLSFHKLGIHPPNASLHSFVLVRNSLLHSILSQQQQDSWLDACFDELTPQTNELQHEDIDMLLLEEEEDDDDEEDEEDEGPVSPEQVDMPYQSRPDGSPAFFIAMDEDKVDDHQEASFYTEPSNEPLLHCGTPS